MGGGEGALGILGCLGGEAVEFPSGFGDWIGSAKSSRKRGQSAGSAPFAALDRPFALRPLLQASRSGFLVRQERLSRRQGTSLSTAEHCEPLGGPSEPNVQEWSSEANGNDEVFCAADGDKE